MKIDHFVVNVDKKYQEDQQVIAAIRNSGLAYEPKYGKGTKGFKASNIWIGNEYFEMIQLLQPNGGGWVTEWVEQYNNGQRGLICLMLDVDDCDQLYTQLQKEQIELSHPQWLEFKYFFNLLTRRMPWRNAYLPFFEKIPLQIGFQQMKDEKARKFMQQYMVPNSRDNGITGIKSVNIQGPFTANDFTMLQTVFSESSREQNKMTVSLDAGQQLHFIIADDYSIELFAEPALAQPVSIENMTLLSAKNKEL